MKKHQNGFTIVELILALFFVGVVGSIGWTVWNSHYQHNKVTPTNSSAPTTNNKVDVKFTTLETSSYASNEQRDNAGFKIDRNRLTVYVGTRLTGGYGYKIDKIKKSSGQLDVYATESRPGKHCVVTQSITYPQATVELNDTITEKIVVHNSVKTNNC